MDRDATVPSTRRVASATRIPCLIFDTGLELARHAAQAMATTIAQRNAEGKQAVLGLPTGSTPLGVYRELIKLHQEQSLDFSQVVVFVIDEYHPIQRDQHQSHFNYIHTQLVSQVNLDPANVHVLKGDVSQDNLVEHCQQFEAQIEEAGGIDLLLLGIGSNGHIGFNEPFGIQSSRTQLCSLDPQTRRAAAADFFSEDNVPTNALTMGLGTMLDAEKIILLALGEGKAAIIRETAEEKASNRVPASFLQTHQDAVALVDTAAAKDLTCQATPWLLGHIQWDDVLVKRAVFWLCEQTGKSLLKLDGHDFRSHSLHQLLREHGPAPNLAHRVFRWMQDTIEYHPAGKDRKKVICFSPHPDDDVISMGGTLNRLTQDGHEVHVAYMTSGNIAVFDHDAKRIADLVTEYNRLFHIEDEHAHQVEARVDQALAEKKPGQLDSDEVRTIKGLIRWSEAKAGAIHVGCQEEHLHFLDLPFYRTGTIAKNPVGPADVQIIRQLIESVAPDQIYVAGDLSDPHGTHRVCAEAIFLALDEIQQAANSLPEVLLYRGAWQEYELHEIEMAVPLSPGDLVCKRQAIFMHESQKDSAVFPGSDPREFWQRAEDRNKGTADSYDQIGLPEYFAMEAFVRWKGDPI